MRLIAAFRARRLSASALGLIASSGLVLSALAAPAATADTGPGLGPQLKVSTASGKLPLRDLPADAAARSEYAHLEPVAAGPCRGMFRLSEGDSCTVGPETLGAQAAEKKKGNNKGNKGLDKNSTTIPCFGDGTSGPRVQWLYVYTGQNSAKEIKEIQKIAAQTEYMLVSNSKRMGGERHLRTVTKKSGKGCVADVKPVKVSSRDLDDYFTSEAKMQKLGLKKDNRKYAMMTDKRNSAICGQGTFNGDTQPGPANLANHATGHARVDRDCWAAGNMLHELFHNMGAVPETAPNFYNAAHCDDEWDMMCYGLDASLKAGMHFVCRGNIDWMEVDDEAIDCHGDDYFNPHPKPGSALDKHWNLANSAFMYSSAKDGNNKGGKNGKNGKDKNKKNKKNKKKKNKNKKRKKKGGAAAGGNPFAAAVVAADTEGPDAVDGLEVTAATDSSVSLAWTAAGDNVGVAEYDIFDADGAHVTSVPGEAVEIEGLAPGKAYTFSVQATDAAGNSGEASSVEASTLARGAKAPVVSAAKGALAKGAALKAGATVTFTNVGTGKGVGVAEAKAGAELISVEAAKATSWTAIAATGDAAKTSVLLQVTGTTLCAAAASAKAEDADGEVITLATCDPASAVQQWRLGTKGVGGGLNLVNAATQLTLGYGDTSEAGHRTLGTYAAEPAWQSRSWTALPTAS